MSERTAIEAIEAIDRDRMHTQMAVNQIISVIQDCIPRACLREAESRLFDALFINGTELTSNLMRKEYEEWKKLQLDIFTLQPTPGVKL